MKCWAWTLTYPHAGFFPPRHLEKHHDQKHIGFKLKDVYWWERVGPPREVTITLGHVCHFCNIMKWLCSLHLCNRIQLDMSFCQKIERWIPLRFSECLYAVWYLGFLVPFQIIQASHTPSESLIYTCVNKLVFFLKTAGVICVVSASEVTEK